MLAKVAEEEDTTVLLSVPNDAFWALENPYHETMWGEGSFDELRRMLPAGTVLVRQVALHGSGAVLLDGDGPVQTSLDVTLDPKGVPTHFLAVMGPRASEVDVQAAVAQVDLDEQRRWERQREADLAYLQAQVDKWRTELQQHHVWFEEWRAYINDLEGRLGISPSGAAREELPSGEQVADKVAAEPAAPDDASS
jgi:hypothetical protein